MSIKKTKTPSGDKWEVLIRSGGRESQRIRRRFERKVDAQLFLDDFRKKQNQLLEVSSEFSNPEEITLKTEADYWLTHSEARLTPGHLKRVAGILRTLLPEWGNLSVFKFTPTFLSTFQQSLLKKKLARNTVNRYTEVITAILNHSIRHRRIPYSPANGFQKLSQISIEMKFWEKNEAVSFLSFTNRRYPKDSDKRWVYTVYLLALNTALRAGEMWGLKVCDMVEDGKTLFIRRQYNSVVKGFTLIKGKKNCKSGKLHRHVPCNQALREELFDIIKKRNLSSVSGDELFFVTENGNPISHDNFQRRFQKDLELWGGKAIRFHDLRHTATTLLISMGIDLKTVQEICGHEDISTTMNYTHLIADNIKKVADLFSIVGI